MPVTSSRTIAFGSPATKTGGRPNCRINWPGEVPFRIWKPSMWSAHWPLRKARWPPQMQHSRQIASGYFLRSAAAGKQKIGRASGRERVCPHGEISVVAVALETEELKTNRQ